MSWFLMPVNSFVVTFKPQELSHLETIILIRCASQLRTTSQESMSVNIMAPWISPERFKWSLRKQLIYIRFTNLQINSSSKGMAYWRKEYSKGFR